MKMKKNPRYFFLLAACGFCSFAFAASNRPASNQAGATPQQAAPAALSDKTAKKISKAIGEEIEDFTVTAQQEIEAPTGFKGTEYTVATGGGKKFKCEILEPSKAGKILSWGIGSGGDAMCTEFSSTGKGKPSPSNRDLTARKPPGAVGATPQQATSTALSDKTAKKISKAIGEEIEDFTVTGQQEIEAPTGFKGTEYTVATGGGKKFKCEILEPSKAGKILTWGIGSGGDAMCTDFTKGSKNKGKTNSASCNALLRAAGKCS